MSGEWVEEWRKMRRSAAETRHRAELDDIEAEAVMMRARAGARPAPRSAGEAASEIDDAVKCDKCGELIRPSKRKDGSIWTPLEKAEYSRKQNGGVVLCYQCAK